MLKNIYTPLSGAIAQERAIDVLSNNLANVNTAGFKEDTVTFTLQNPNPYPNYKSPIPPANYKVAFRDLMHLHGNDLNYAGVAGLERNGIQGPTKITNNQQDLLIEGKGHFQINTDEGIRYQRAGNLALNPDGALVTQLGHPVMGEKGTIYLRSGAFQVNRIGEIYQDGQLIDKLKIYDFVDENQIERVGNNYVYYDGPEDGVFRVDNPSLLQGHVEASNVNAVKSLTALILAHRSYEAYQKAVKNYDTMMDKSANAIGSVRA